MKPLFINGILVGSLLLGLNSCGDLVDTEDTKACRVAFNKRDYDTALEKCTEREDIAASYLGKAGFDIVNILESSENEVEAIEEATITAVLGTQEVSGASMLNILKVGPADIENYADRLEAVKTSKINLEEAIDLLEAIPAEDLSQNEKFLEIFSSIFALQLELLMLIDVGEASTLDPNDSAGIETQIANNLADIASGATTASGFHKITKDSAGEDFEEGVLLALDGKVWTNEQNLALLPTLTLTDPVQIALLGSSTLDLGGNLSPVCTSVTSTGKNSETTEPKTRGLITLYVQLLKAIAKLPSGELSDNDFLSNINESSAEIDEYIGEIEPLCQSFAN